MIMGGNKTLRKNVEMTPDEILSTRINPERERATVRQLSVVAAVIFTALVPLLVGFAPYLVNLEQPEHFSYWHILVSPLALSGIFVVLFIAVIWLASIRVDQTIRKGRFNHFPLAAVSALIILIGASLLVEQYRFQWFFLEAVKVRSEQYSYPRSLAFWKRDAMDEIHDVAKRKIILLGSSQVNMAMDPIILSEHINKTSISKYALPGFGIMQYLMVAPYLLKMKPDAVVCWLSEFDTYREELLPSNRLRSFSSAEQFWALSGLLKQDQIWKNRSELMDIMMGAATPIWRDRDLLRRLAFKFWWRSRIVVNQKPINTVVHQKKVDNHIENLKTSIQRTGLVEANFLAFDLFSRILIHNGISLYVFEGVTNPDATSRYDPDGNMRLDTRERFEKMAKATGFKYIRASKMPAFEVNDFADAVHLNARARERFSTYLASYLKNREQ